MARGTVKCDGCHELFEPRAGLVCMDNYMVTVDAKGSAETFGGGDDGQDELEFCPSCSEKLLLIFGHARDNPEK